MKITLGPIAIARFPHAEGAFLLYAKSLADKLRGNAALPDPDPSLAVYELDVAALDDALTRAETPATRADRDAKALKVRWHIQSIVHYVQGVANSQVSAADAIAVILSAGLDVKKTGGRTKPALAAKYTGVSGEVLLEALAVAGAGAYFWEFSLDQALWSPASETKRGRTRLAGLTPGKVYFFRFRALTDEGKSDPSQVVSLMVH